MSWFNFSNKEKKVNKNVFDLREKVFCLKSIYVLEFKIRVVNVLLTFWQDDFLLPFLLITIRELQNGLLKTLSHSDEIREENSTS